MKRSNLMLALLAGAGAVALAPVHAESKKGGAEVSAAVQQDTLHSLREVKPDPANFTKMRDRVEHDLYYIDHWSLWLDIKILWRTAFVCFSGRNAY